MPSEPKSMPGADPHEYWLPHQFRLAAACCESNTLIVTESAPANAQLAIAAEVFFSSKFQDSTTGSTSGLYVAPTTSLASAASKVFAMKEGLEVTWLRFRQDGEPYRKRIGVGAPGEAPTVLVTTAEALAMAQGRAPSSFAFGTFGVVCLDEAARVLDSDDACSKLARNLLRSGATPRVIGVIAKSPRVPVIGDTRTQGLVMRALRITQVSQHYVPIEQRVNFRSYVVPGSKNYEGTTAHQLSLSLSLSLSLATYVLRRSSGSPRQGQGPPHTMRLVVVPTTTLLVPAPPPTDPPRRLHPGHTSI